MSIGDGYVTGSVTLTSCYDQGQMIGVRVDRADARIVISPGVLQAIRDNPAPGVELRRDFVIIEAVNGRFVYQMLPGEVAAEHGIAAQLVSAPADRWPWPPLLDPPGPSR